MPRSTLDDVVRESSNKADLVEYRDGDWYSAQSGRLACRAHRNYLDQLDSLGMFRQCWISWTLMKR